MWSAVRSPIDFFDQWRTRVPAEIRFWCAVWLLTGPLWQVQTGSASAGSIFSINCHLAESPARRDSICRVVLLW